MPRVPQPHIAKIARGFCGVARRGRNVACPAQPQLRACALAIGRQRLRHDHRGSELFGFGACAVPRGARVAFCRLKVTGVSCCARGDHAGGNVARVAGDQRIRIGARACQLSVFQREIRRFAHLFGAKRHSLRLRAKRRRQKKA